MERNGQNGADALVQRQSGRTAAVAAATREQTEIQAAMVVAHRFPRQEETCFAKVVSSCKRPSFAECARYLYSRGGNKIEGPSVRLARECARIWGNIRYGYSVVDVVGDTTFLEGWAYDLESNTRVAVGVDFKRLIFRKGRDGAAGRWIEPDERDYRELVAKNGAIVSRNAVLQLLPPDLIEDAMGTIRGTVLAAAKGEIKQSREQAARRVVYAFREHGVTQEMIEGYLDHAISLITEEDVAELRGILTAITDGQARREEFFDLSGGKGDGAADDDAPPQAESEGNAAAKAAPTAPLDELTKDLRNGAARVADKGSSGTPKPTPAAAPTAPPTGETCPECDQPHRPSDPCPAAGDDEPPPHGELAEPPRRGSGIVPAPGVAEPKRKRRKPRGPRQPRLDDQR